MRQTRGDHVGVLDRHHRALAEKRQGRMAGVAEERNSPLRPAFHRPARQQRPFVRRRDIIDECMHVGVPAAKIAGEFVLAAFDDPGFDLPIVAFDNADEIHQFAATHRIMQHVAVRAEPVRGEKLRQMRR